MSGKRCQENVVGVLHVGLCCFCSYFCCYQINVKSFGLSKMNSLQYNDVMSRYSFKVTIFCDGVNPYDLEIKNCKDPLPATVAYFDVVNYCINKESLYTFEYFLESNKALESYNIYESGWMRESGR